MNPPHPLHLPPDLREALAEEHADERAALEETWRLADRYRRSEPSDEVFAALGQEIWANLESALAAEAVPAAAPAPERPRLRLVRAPLRRVEQRVWRYSALAACLALLVAVGLSLRPGATSFTAPAGQTLAVELPDGSDVVLNSGATLTHRAAFGEDSRTVTLEGEAYFDVATDATPFVIESFNGTVTVLGTEFNVRAHEADGAMLVAVREGTVRVAPRRAPAEALVLEAGQAARLAAPDAAPEPIAETATALAWLDGGFKFEGAPLGTVLREVERRFDVRVRVRDEALLETNVTILREKPLAAEEILRDIQEYYGFEYRAIPGGFEMAPSAGF